jgi:uncharacterized membrane protein YfcA
LLLLAETEPILSYNAFGHRLHVLPAKLIVGLLLLVFVLLEFLPLFRTLSFPPRFMPVGGLLSGFFGGLAGLQGALRSAFLIKAGLEKERYIATGTAIALLIDIARLTVYVPLFDRHKAELDYPLLATGLLAAFAGALLGNRYLEKVTMGAVQNIVAALLLLCGVALVLGVL